MKPLRIVFVLPGSGISGGVRTTQRFASGLLERGHRVSILFGRRRTDWKARLLSAYVGLRYPENRDWLLRFDGRLHAYNRLTPELVGENDVILAVGPWAARAVAALPESCGVKIEHVRGSAQPKEIVLEAWRRPWPKIVCGDHLRAAIEAAGCGPVAAVVPHGVDRDEYFPDPTATERLGVGTVWHRGGAKDPETLLDVLDRVRAQRPDVPFFMFGHHRPPAHYPSNTSFVRYPSIPAARRLYSQCRVWFCSSRSEGSPNPVLEAMACGCALVSTNCGGPSQFIDDGQNGFLVPIGDAEALTSRIVELLENHQLRETFVRRSLSRVKQLSWPAAVENLENALVRILRNGCQTGETAHATSLAF